MGCGWVRGEAGVFRKRWVGGWVYLEGQVGGCLEGWVERRGE